MNAKHIILNARDIHKSFYHPAEISLLKGIDLTIYQGDIVAIMGRSGEGKSTLLHILGTLETPCSGKLQIADQDISPFNKSLIRNKHIAFIFQSFHLLEDYTALENVLMPAKIARKTVTKGSPAYQKGMELLEHVGLLSRAHFYTKLLSGGEKQRVAIARALCNDPDIIFADEPSGNLDRQTALHIHDLLLDFAHQKNKTVILVTHDEELAGLCKRRFYLRKGKLVEEINI